ncbi:MAG: hypothetical protein WA324_27885 [Bryobacteraceae bacterium]
MIETLMEAKLISPKEMKLYQLFTSNLGREVFTELKEELFWEEPTEEVMTEGVLGFYDGRRSVLRGIKTAIDKVEHMIHKQNLEAKND